ncbi:uncharacterized protein LOC121192140 [Xyrichtys novacula]|uniref:Uncharacterized protein LOC121192140 n=1 Tax=Xyrichtys novacula TaxID=13765 RepID=A0AAV1HC68_XYRNO|nr:uncharacterized protein LOC121192140 [Xyrichtys novacula]
MDGADFVCVRGARGPMERLQQLGSQHKMRPSSQLTLLSLALLLPVPHSVTSYPRLPTAIPKEDGPELESILLRLQALLEDPSNAWLIQPGEWANEWPRDPRQREYQPWAEDAVLRTQRGDPSARLLSPFPGSHSLESLSYQDGGEGDEGGKRNQALTFIAGGLQAVSREKGGFGFRFGRK